jgi:peroxiredoxin
LPPLPSTPSSTPSEAPPARSRRARWILGACGLALVVVVGAITWVSVASNNDSKSSAAPDPRLGQVSVKGVATVGAPAPDFTLQTLDGKTVHLSDYRGKPVVVNFWASWCIPCRAEFPMLRKQLAQHDDDFVLLGVDFKDIPSDARTFAKEQHATWPILEDPTNAVSQAYGVRAVPQTFFIGRDGTISQRYYAQPEAGVFDRELANIRKPLPARTPTAATASPTTGG